MSAGLDTLFLVFILKDFFRTQTVPDEMWDMMAAEIRKSNAKQKTEVEK